MIKIMIFSLNTVRVQISREFERKISSVIWIFIETFPLSSSKMAFSFFYYKITCFITAHSSRKTSQWFVFYKKRNRKLGYLCCITAHSTRTRSLFLLIDWHPITDTVETVIYILPESLCQYPHQPYRLRKLTCITLQYKLCKSVYECLYQRTEIFCARLHILSLQTIL
jgi:hypothetical protein